jgi:hypothetical protein
MYVRAGPRTFPSSSSHEYYRDSDFTVMKVAGNSYEILE